MQLSKYNSGSNVEIRKNVIQEGLKLSAERIVGNGAQTSNQNPIPSKKNWKCIIAISSIAGTIIIIGLIVLIVLLRDDDKCKVDCAEISSTQINTPPPKPPTFNLPKAKEVFSPSYKISSKEDTLTQLSEKSIQRYESMANGERSSNNIFNKAIFDIYTINSTSASEEEKNFFTKKYTTAITVNSLCSKVSSDPENDDCELEENLNLNKRDESNLRRNEENVDELISKAILPICIIEHTDTNIIISVTCPETLTDSYKDNIILAFRIIKPCTIKGYEFDKNYVNTNSEEKDDKIYTNSYDNVCNNPNDDPSKTIICNLTKDIITDKEGVLISSKIKNRTKTIIDEDNSSTNTFEYEFKNISKGSSGFDEKTYKKNLESFFSITKSIMKKEIMIKNFTDCVVDTMSVDDEQDNVTHIRNLMEKSAEVKGVYKENIYKKIISNISISLNLTNDIALLQGQSAKAISIHDVNNEEYNELSINQLQTNLNETLNQFISLPKSASKIATKLYEDLNGPLLNFMDIISQNIEKINEFLAKRDLSELFDSTLILNKLDSLPFDFIAATDNLYTAMKDLKDNILYTIDNARNKLKNDVSTFLTNSHNFMFKLFGNLSELTEALSTNQNKIAEITSYYLNYTDTSYYEIIKEAKNILDHYYENEKNLIYPLINKKLESFEENTLDIIKKYQDMIASISERLNDGNLVIVLAGNEDYQKTITNLYNAKIIGNEIIEIVKNKFLESINLKSNGYFMTDKEISDNAQSYGQKGETALSMAYALDNNEFIDKTFDELMISFRNKFMELIKSIENSSRDKFPLEENVLGTTLFQSTFLDEIEEYFKTQKINILNFIDNENNEYLKSINDILKSFNGENGKSLDQIMSDLLKDMTDLYLDNLNTAYDESLDTTFKKINEIIEYNRQLAIQYLTNVKKASSYHITTGFVKKYNIYVSSFETILDYINKNLKINLSNKYKNVITQIRSLLQSIKSNSILDKYYKQLPSAEKHLNSIKDLFEIFNRHITDSIYNMRFLPLINNFIKNANDNINITMKDLKAIYDVVAKKNSKNMNSDYDKERVVGSRYCCARFLICFRHCTRYYYYYDPYNVEGTNNHLNLTYINFEEYMLKFNEKYNELYPGFSNNILSYNSLLSKLDAEINNETKKNEFNDKNIYLDNITEKINSIIEEKLGNNLLTASYNYYKNKITNNLPNELNNIIEQWKNTYDEIYNDINSNKDKFKSSILEFYSLGIAYQQTYIQNISYEYFESIVDKLKNDFNYTNKYYYNIIISELNKTYSYILNNLPNNEKPFDEILNKRINEIKTSYNNLLLLLKNSKNEIIDKTKQEITLQVNSKNFFYINDIIKDHIKLFNSSLGQKVNNLMSIAIQNYKENPEELIAAKLYLENSINGNHTKENYDSINKATFVDLQTDVYKKLIDDIWKIDRDELIKNILNTLKKFNETNKNSFKYEQEKYIEILQNKLYNEFYTKDGLITKINSFFSNGLNNCKEDSKNQIVELLNSVLDKVKAHITNEASRLSNELTSYSISFTDIKNRLNNYKNEIYEKFTSTITSKVDTFHNQLSEKFYKNFIEKGLNEYEENIEKTDFGTANFLNMSINLNEVIKKEFQLLITDYKNLALNQIQFLYQKNIQTLSELFSFTQMKSKIYSEIDNIYNDKLLPELKKVGTHNPGDEGVSNYDLPEVILNDINDFLSEKISQVKNIMREMEGNEYKINDTIPADFSGSKGDIYDQITQMFKNFTISYVSKEKKEFDEIVGENSVNNFKNLMNNFIPTFGVDFFNRILKYNEIQKVKQLYHNLKYSSAQTISYYIFFVSMNEEKYLPVDIKLKLYNLNNLDSIIINKNNYIISNLNDKIEAYFEETKNYIVNKYIDDMNTNEEFDLKFKANLKNIIKGRISGNIHNYENDYINMMRENIKNPFISDYTKVLNEATNDMKNVIENTKIQLKAELDNMFTLDSDTVLANIQKKLNNTKYALDQYNKHFETFKISEEVLEYLDTFGEKIIVPKYYKMKELIDKRTAELVIINLEKLSNEFRDLYSVENFQDEINKLNLNLTSYFDEFDNILKQYGSIENVYKQNLEREIANNKQIRFLDENNEGQSQISEVKYDITFNNLKQTSSMIKDFIQSLNLFNNFEENINKYINDKNKEYSLTKYNLENNKNNNENYDLMNERLDELNNLSISYYTQTKNLYNIMKEKIIDDIIKINDLINTCEKVTLDTIANKYIEIKDNFNRIEENKNSEKTTITIPPYNTRQSDNYFTVETTVENYLIDSKIILDIITKDDGKTYEVIEKIINNIKPKVFDIDFYSTTGQNGKLGRKIKVVFNNITSYSNIIFNPSLNKATITTNFDFDEYSIKTQYYETKFDTIKKVIMGMTIIIPGIPKTVDVETPDGEKLIHVNAKNKTLIENLIY